MFPKFLRAEVFWKTSTNGWILDKKSAPFTLSRMCNQKNKGQCGQTCEGLEDMKWLKERTGKFLNICLVSWEFIEIEDHVYVCGVL